MSFAPGDWYQTLNKPSFNPPSWVFGPVWTLLYILIAVAGARSYMARPKSVVMKFWVAQMVANWLWSPLFFGKHLIFIAFLDILLLLALIIGFMLSAWKEDRLSAYLFIPYLLWVSFATILNGTIVWIN